MALINPTDENAPDENTDMCEMVTSSCCYPSYYQYTVHCGIAEDMSEFKAQCPDADMNAVCPGSNIKGMSCFEEAKEAPSSYSSVEEIEKFCETGSMKVDKSKCDLWSCCEWADGECFADLSAEGEECSCTG